MQASEEIGDIQCPQCRGYCEHDKKREESYNSGFRSTGVLGEPVIAKVQRKPLTLNAKVRSRTKERTRDFLGHK